MVRLKEQEATWRKGLLRYLRWQRQPVARLRQGLYVLPECMCTYVAHVRVASVCVCVCMYMGTCTLASVCVSACVCVSIACA